MLPRRLPTIRALAAELAASRRLAFVEALRLLTEPGELVVVLPAALPDGGAA